MPPQPEAAPVRARGGWTAFSAIDDSLTGYLASAEVDLTPTDDWADFFLHRRLKPLLHKAIELSELPPDAADLLDALVPRVPELCGPREPPALVHGDLWAGNRLVSTDGWNWLVDPACFWAHREVDLAMMQLFGGFSVKSFSAYDEAFPLADGWQDRIPWYQLPPLLVHAILFGGSYGASVMQVLSGYQ